MHAMFLGLSISTFFKNLCYPEVYPVNFIALVGIRTSWICLPRLVQSLSALWVCGPQMYIGECILPPISKNKIITSRSSSRSKIGSCSGPTSSSKSAPFWQSLLLTLYSIYSKLRAPDSTFSACTDMSGSTCLFVGVPYTSFSSSCRLASRIIR